MKARTTTAAGVLVALTGTVGLAAPGQADNHTAAVATRLVVDGLNNPRQLNWTADGQTLIIAEAGVGEADCASEEGCIGNTGAVTTVDTPWMPGAEAVRVVEGLWSAAAPDGSFALGTTGADGVEAVYPGEFVAVRNALDNPVDTDQGLYFVADSMGEEPPPGTPEEHVLPGGDFIFTLADLFEAEAAQNPGGGAIESNPYAVLFVDPTPDVADNDGYALVADAGANTVWKVEPDYDAPVPAECEAEQPPPDFDFSQCIVIDVTVFASWPDRTSPEGGPVEFVPTSIASDDDGNIYVGGLGSEATGEASVVKFGADGAELDEWTGFTGITGVAVHDDHLYVSELFGAVPPAQPGEGPPPIVVPGDVVRMNMTTGQMRMLEVPFPAGLAVDAEGNVYASVNSIAPAGGIQDVFGPGSLDIGGGAVWELDFDAPQPRATNDSCTAEIPEDGFRDVPASSPFERMVDCLFYWDITKGTSATTYSPGSPVTREQMAAFIARLVVQSGGTLPEGRDAFRDDESSNFEADINRLAAAGIVNGTGVGTFSPKLLVTRAQMAAFLVRAYDYRAEQEGLEPLTTDVDFFPDDEWSTLEDAINAAASVGIAAGHVDGTYRPRDAVRRDHMAAFLMRELDLMVENGITEVP